MPYGKRSHGSARTAPRLRAEFQASKESSRALAARYGLNAKTVRKWRNRTTTAEEADEHGADAGRGVDRGGVPAEDPAAAGRCPGLLARRDPSPHSQRLAQMPATPRHLPVADRGDQGAAQTVQDLRDRLRSHR